MAASLVEAGHKIGKGPSDAEVIIVNTCGFITDAADESVDTILEMLNYKKNGTCRRLIVTGCLAERFKDDDLVFSLPEVDVFFGTGAIDFIVAAVEDNSNTFGDIVDAIKDSSGILTFFPDPNKKKFQSPPFKRKPTLNYSAYVKISEGCNRKCTYCIIPRLRGIQRCRPAEDIICETKNLIMQDVKEIIFTAENTSDYNLIDLSRLLEKISDEADKYNKKIKKPVKKPNATPKQHILKQPIWLRLLYTHPSSLSRRIIKTISRLNNFCSYYDVPVQHASTNILKKMGRPYTKTDLYSLFEYIRKTDSNSVLRTTVITGFPGETEKDFNILLNFIKDIRFNHLGVFVYSDSDDIKSHNLKDHVPENTALERRDIIMTEQAKISEKLNTGHLGKIYKVLVEENPDDGIYLGRTSFQAPEVDGITFIYGSGLEIGTFVDVKITETYEYDLAGEIITGK